MSYRDESVDTDRNIKPVSTIHTFLEDVVYKDASDDDPYFEYGKFLIFQLFKDLRGNDE